MRKSTASIPNQCLGLFSIGFKPNVLLQGMELTQKSTRKLHSKVKKYQQNKNKRKS